MTDPDPIPAPTDAAGKDRPIEIALLAAQLDSSMEFCFERLAGLSDDEYFWRPAAGAWSVVPRGTQSTDRIAGRGGFVFEFQSPPPEPAPMRTIAWLIWHMSSCCLGRADYTIGDHSLTLDEIECPGTAAGGVALLARATARWRSVFDLLAPEEYAVVGRSDYPWGLDPRLPLRDILWWQNREMIHHAADIGTLRDLYAWRQR